MKNVIQCCSICLKKNQNRRIQVSVETGIQSKVNHWNNILRKTTKSHSGITSVVTTSKTQCIMIWNENDMALDVTPKTN